MLEEAKIVETNFKGQISISDKLIEKVVFKLVSYSSQYKVNSVKLQNIEGFSQKMFVVEMKKRTRHSLFWWWSCHLSKTFNLIVKFKS